MKSPYSLSDEELMDYAEIHIQYEFDMLTWSANILAFCPTSKDQGYIFWAIENGLLNTFSIHARNLIDFLYSRSKNKDHPTDIVIQDYVEEEIVVDLLGQIPKSLDTVLTKANKQVAHLTMDRIDYEKAGKEWEFIDIYIDIRKVLAAVVPQISKYRISDSFRFKLLKSKIMLPKINVSIEKTSTGDPFGVYFILKTNN